MDIKEIENITNNVGDHPNKVLLEIADNLYHEFEKTKKIALEMTNYMDYIEKLYNKVGGELKNRNIPENE